MKHLVNVLNTFPEGLSDHRHVESLLSRLFWIDSDESRTALLAIFREGQHVKGLEETWGRILSEMDHDGVKEALGEHLNARLATPGARGLDSTALWRALFAQLGEEAGAEVRQLLASPAISTSSRYRGEIIDAIIGPLDADTREAVQRELKNHSVAREAFNALVRAGDEASLDAAARHLTSGGHFAPSVAAVYGLRLTEDRARELYTATQQNDEALSSYLSAAANAPPEVRSSELERMGETALRALRHYDRASDPHGLHRRAVAAALVRVGPQVASSDLLRAVVKHIDKYPVGRSQLVRVARKMRDVLRSRERASMPGSVTLSPGR